MENKNIFDETVETLINDAKSLQKKFTVLQEKNDFRGALDAMRLLKDTLSLIRDYDWELMYSEYKTDGHKQIAIWEQNHCGEIRNHKKWVVNENRKNIDTNRWCGIFDDYIVSGKGYICKNGNQYRDSGKSYSLAKLCSKYNGCIVVLENKIRALGINNNCEKFHFDCNIITYKDAVTLKQFKNKILFVDENSGLSSEQIERLQENHIVIGFN